MVSTDENEQKWSGVKVPTRLLEEVEAILPNTSIPNVSRFVDQAVREKIERVKADAAPKEVPA